MSALVWVFAAVVMDADPSVGVDDVQVGFYSCDNSCNSHICLANYGLSDEGNCEINCRSRVSGYNVCFLCSKSLGLFTFSSTALVTQNAFRVHVYLEYWSRWYWNRFTAHETRFGEAHEPHKTKCESTALQPLELNFVSKLLVPLRSLCYAYFVFNQTV